jgi:hypothetical protein
VKKLFVKLKLRAMNNCCFELNKSLFNIDGGGGCENYEEVANYAALPATGDTDTTYKTLDNGNIYEWNGSAYVLLVEQTTPIGQTLMKTGQTTSYRTGDDGDIEAGRETDFFTLEENNPFGNLYRFTGTTGGYQTGGSYYDKDGVVNTSGLAFPNDIVIDWSTTKSNGTKVLGLRRTISFDTYANTETAYASLNIGGYIGWRIPNINELLNFCIKSGTTPLNFNPININNGVTFFSSTLISTTITYIVSNVSFSMTADTIAASRGGFPIREFTVTGTTLT